MSCLMLYSLIYGSDRFTSVFEQSCGDRTVVPTNAARIPSLVLNRRAWCCLNKHCFARQKHQPFTPPTGALLKYPLLWTLYIAHLGTFFPMVLLCTYNVSTCMHPTKPSSFPRSRLSFLSTFSSPALTLYTTTSIHTYIIYYIFFLSTRVFPSLSPLTGLA